MAYNKVIYDGSTLIDLTGDTVTADTLKEGVTAHDKSGVVITGTMTVPELVGDEYQVVDHLLDSDSDSILDDSGQPIDGVLVYRLV